MSGKHAIEKRIFIVGCPRSGTTLLQAMLAAHPQVFSLPETFFFAKVRPRNWIKRYLMWPAIKVRAYLPELVTEMGRNDLLSQAKIGVFQHDYHRPFVEIMDRLATDSGKNIWVEKTPWHLYCVDEIMKKIPDAEIIHLVRDGRDVVASFVNATRKNPQQFARFGRGSKWKNWNGVTIDAAVQRWNRDFLITKKSLKIANNTVVKFEDIIENPTGIAKQLCDLLDIQFSKSMISPDSLYGKVVRADEPWKENNAKKIGDIVRIYEEIFTRSERQLIEESLIPYEL